ncbi:hypothetical protein [Nocardia carnea]|uniref:WXG100-like domain-containing protein n=1 Tax=Nocardia carnea TaxID=37328 RepID=UPI0024550BEA|nr:hypothetical protein [Nocardia carnea]
MTLEIPKEIPSWVITAVAGPWPEGDEDALRRLGAAWKEIGDAITTVSQLSGKARERAVSAIEGQTGDALEKYGIDLGGDLKHAADACYGLSDQCMHNALLTEYSKYVIIGSLVALVIQLGVDAFVPGVGQVHGAAATAATRLTVRAAFRELITGLGAEGARAAAARLVRVIAFKGVTLGAIQGGAIPLAAQAVQMTGPENYRTEFDWNDIGLGVVSGAAAGAAGEFFGVRTMVGLERRFVNNAASTAGNRLTQVGIRFAGAAAGGAAGAIAGVASVVPFTGQLDLGWDHLLPGMVGGVLGSMPHALRGPAGPEIGAPTGDGGRPGGGGPDAGRRIFASPGDDGPPPFSPARDGGGAADGPGAGRDGTAPRGRHDDSAAPPSGERDSPGAVRTEGNGQTGNEARPESVARTEGQQRPDTEVWHDDGAAPRPNEETGESGDRRTADRPAPPGEAGPETPVSASREETAPAHSEGETQPDTVARPEDEGPTSGDGDPPAPQPDNGPAAGDDGPFLRLDLGGPESPALPADAHTATLTRESLTAMLHDWSSPDYVADIAGAVGDVVEHGRGTVRVTAETVGTPDGFRELTIEVTHTDAGLVRTIWQLDQNPRPVERVVRGPDSTPPRERAAPVTVGDDRVNQMWGREGEAVYQSSVGQQRQALADQLSETYPWLTDEQIGDAQLILSELYTNSVTYSFDHRAVVEVTAPEDGRVRVSVSNSLAPGEAMKMADWIPDQQPVERQGGRGTQLAHAFSDSCGRVLRFGPEGSRATHWFEIHRAGDTGDTSGVREPVIDMSEFADDLAALGFDVDELAGGVDAGLREGSAPPAGRTDGADSENSAPDRATARPEEGSSRPQTTSRPEDSGEGPAEVGPQRRELELTAADRAGDEYTQASRAWDWLDSQIPDWPAGRRDDLGSSLAETVAYAARSTDGDFRVVLDVRGEPGDRILHARILDHGTETPPDSVLEDPHHGRLEVNTNPGDDSQWSREISFTARESPEFPVWLRDALEQPRAEGQMGLRHIRLNSENDLVIAVQSKHFDNLLERLSQFDPLGRNPERWQDDADAGLRRSGRTNHGKVGAEITEFQAEYLVLRNGDETVELHIYPFWDQDFRQGLRELGLAGRGDRTVPLTEFSEALVRAERQRREARPAREE